MKFKRSLLIFTILLVVLVGINTAFAIDSNSTIANGVGDDMAGSENSILETEDINQSADYGQKLSQGNVIVLDAEDNHNEMDDSTIQVAINNAQANDTIIINGKSYVHCHFVVDKQLTIISNVGTTMTPCPSNTQGSGYRGIFYISPEASGTVIEGFTIINNMVSGENDYGILVRGASDVVIRNCEIRSSAQADALRVENAKNTRIENVAANSLTNAIMIKNSQNTILNNSEIRKSNIGVNIVGSLQTTLVNNVITSNKVSGVHIGEKTSYTTISANNITSNNGKGIAAESADNLYILNNYIALNKNGDSGAGIYINCNVNNLEIKGNLLQENGNYAVLYDYRVRNIGPDGVGENVATVNNNYIFGHTDRAIYHITYVKASPGSFIYDAENDVYTAVGYGNGDYMESMNTAYLGYAYLINEQLCPSIYYTWGSLWSQGNYRLVLSDISQIKKGTYSVSVIDPNGDVAKDLSSIYATFYLNKANNLPKPQEGDVYKTVLIQNGTATVRFYADDFKESGNVLTVSLPGPNPTLTANPFKRLNIDDSEIPGNATETILTLSNLTTYPNSGEYVVGNLKDVYGKALSNQNITFAVDSKSYVETTDEDGNARFKVPLTKEGTYEVTATFEGDDVDYLSSDAKSYVVIKKIASKIESGKYYVVPGITDYYVVVLTDKNGTPISGQKVTFNVDGKNQVATTNSKGQASLKVLFDRNNINYKVTVTYAGNDKYSSCSNSSFILVRYSSKDAKLIVPVVGVLPNTPKYYTVTLKGFNGRIPANEELIINIDGVKYYEKTDSKGQVTLKVQFSQLKDYKVNVLYKGNKIYKRTSMSGFIRVAKVTTKFNAQSTTALPNVAKQIPVVLKTFSGERLANQKISIEIDGKTYSKTTNANGDALINFVFIKEKNFQVTLSYAGNDKYKDIKATIYVNVKKIDTSLESYDRTFSKGSAQNFTVALTDENSSPMSNQNVVFTFNGKNITKITDLNGQAGINVASAVGSFDIVISYPGSDKYNSISKTNKITVLDEKNIVYIDSDLPNSEIQKILDACDDGDVVKFLGDSYDDISLRVSKQLDISPQGKTTLNALNSAPAFNVLAENTNISGFTISANSGGGIDVGADNVKIQNNVITNTLDSSKSEEYFDGTVSMPGYGISISNSVNSKIINNTVSLFESGIYAEESSKLTIDNNVLKEDNYGVKYGFGVSNTEITNNLITELIGLYTMEVPEGPRGYGLFLNNSAVNVSITHNVITWNHLGISFDANKSTGIVATGNLITDNVLEGIRFNAGYDLAENAVEPVITDNAIYRNARGPSMMILGEMSANPGGIYSQGEWDDNAKLKVAANWYGVNALRTWNNDTGIVGIGTMCPRIKTSEIKFDEIVAKAPGTYSVTFKKDGEVASNLCEFDLYATLNKGSDNEVEVNFNVVNGVGEFGFDAAKISSGSTIDISVGSLNSQERAFKSFYTYHVPDGEIPV